VSEKWRDGKEPDLIESNTMQPPTQSLIISSQLNGTVPISSDIIWEYTLISFGIQLLCKDSIAEQLSQVDNAQLVAN